jgi:hypothetical protein
MNLCIEATCLAAGAVADPDATKALYKQSTIMRYISSNKKCINNLGSLKED